VMLLLDCSKFYSIRYISEERSFYVDFGQKKVKLTFCQLLALRQKINSISISSHFDSEQGNCGFEILTLCNNEHLFVLNTLELLDLKSLIQNSFAVMGLSQRIVPVSV